jgi:hypothetical protein
MLCRTPEIQAGGLDAAELVSRKAVLGVVLEQVDRLAGGLQESAAELGILHVQRQLVRRREKNDSSVTFTYKKIMIKAHIVR